MQTKAPAARQTFRPDHPKPPRCPGGSSAVAPPSTGTETGGVGTGRRVTTTKRGRPKGSYKGPNAVKKPENGKKGSFAQRVASPSKSSAPQGVKRGRGRPPKGEKQRALEDDSGEGGGSVSSERAAKRRKVDPPVLPLAPVAVIKTEKTGLPNCRSERTRQPPPHPTRVSVA